MRDNNYKGSKPHYLHASSIQATKFQTYKQNDETRFGYQIEINKHSPNSKPINKLILQYKIYKKVDNILPVCLNYLKDRYRNCPHSS